MGLQRHCLFCLEQIVPYKIDSSCEEEFSKTLTFQTVCKYLKITFPKEDGSDPAVLSMTWDEFLCLGCFEMMEESRRLYGEMENVQRKIEDVVGRMKKIIVSHNISENLSKSDKTLREAFEQKVCKVSKGEGVCLAFVERFQALVKEADGDNCEEDNTCEFTDERVLSSHHVTIHPTDSIEVHPERVKVEAEVTSEGEDILGDNLSMDFDGERGVNDTEFDRKEFVIGVTEAEDAADEEWRPDKRRNTSKATKSRTPIKRKRLSTSRTCKKSRTVIAPPSKQKRAKEPAKEEEHFKCPDCDLSFSKNHNMWAHRRKDHPREMSTLERIMSMVPVLPIENPTGNKRIKFNCLRVCTVCNLHVREIAEHRLTHYMEHMLSHEEDTPPDLPGPHKCTECDKEFRLKLNLEIHKGCIHEARQVVIRCEYCTNYKQGFRTREDLIEHLKSEHSQTIYSCKNCSMSYITLEKLLMHMNKHRLSKRLYCPQCSTVTTSVTRLNRHCAKEHPEVKELFSCDFCGKSDFVSDADLRHHKSTVCTMTPEASKNQEGKFACDICKNGKDYQTKRRLENHIYIQHGDGKKFQCDKCERRFASRPSLQEHIEKDHENLRHICSICGNNYKGLVQLKQHMRIHTGEEMLACHICGKMFPSTSRLNMHLRSHKLVQPEEKVECDECGKEFDCQYRLGKHKTNVHPKKTLECSVCKLKFKRKDQLRSHFRTHTGERPFTCHICQKAFNRRDIMRVHVKGVHGVEYSEISKT